MSLAKDRAPGTEHERRRAPGRPDLSALLASCAALLSLSTPVQAAPRDTLDFNPGFRKTEFGGGVVRLNDRLIQLKGYAQRSANEWSAIGLAVPPWLSDYSNGLVVESWAAARPAMPSPASPNWSISRTPRPVSRTSARASWG